jgi:hypothetical protein
MLRKLRTGTTRGITQQKIRDEDQSARGKYVFAWQRLNVAEAGRFRIIKASQPRPTTHILFAPTPNSLSHSDQSAARALINFAQIANDI